MGHSYDGAGEGQAGGVAVTDLFPTVTTGQTLRPYQEDAVAAVLKEWETSQSVIGEAGTGLGKTTIASALLKRTGYRALVLCHRSEILHQFRSRLAQFGIHAEIEMADHRASSSRLHRRTIVATPQTLYSGSNGAARMMRFNPDDFDAVIVDECHHFTSPAFYSVVDYFRRNKR
jgi:ATP-dependent helicase IRC3